MSDDITIPPEALEAVARVLHDHAEIFDDLPWEDLSDGDQEAYMDEARAACIAMLRAWGGDVAPAGAKRLFFVPHLCLPLPQEASDE